MENQPEQEIRAPRELGTIYVGKKPTMEYVLACLTHIQNGNEELTVKARGKAISRAVDVAQILTKRVAVDLKVASVSINTELVRSQINNETSNVSSIEIKLHR